VALDHEEPHVAQTGRKLAREVEEEQSDLPGVLEQAEHQLPRTRYGEGPAVHDGQRFPPGFRPLVAGPRTTLLFPMVRRTLAAEKYPLQETGPRPLGTPVSSPSGDR